MNPRVYLVGTDTHVGKTTLACALIRSARRHGTRILPFKPAESGCCDGVDDDATRLLRAAQDPSLTLQEISPLRFREPIAPGLAHASEHFVEPARAPDLAPLELVTRALAQLESRHRPDLVLIEGAGGLNVPMPGGTWQPQWIRALSARTLVVAADRLGTINHTLLTLSALQTHHVCTLGFVLCQCEPRFDASRQHNRLVLERATNARCFGVLSHGLHDEAPWLRSLCDATLA